MSCWCLTKRMKCWRVGLETHVFQNPGRVWLVRPLMVQLSSPVCKFFCSFYSSSEMGYSIPCASVQYHTFFQESFFNEPSRVNPSQHHSTGQHRNTVCFTLLSSIELSVSFCLGVALDYDFLNILM